MNELRDDSVTLNAQENDHTVIEEERRAWVAGLRKRALNTISLDGAAITTDRNDNNNSNIMVPSINRIPKYIREVDPSAYEPQVISLGPYNRDKSRLKDMEKVKWRYFGSLLRHNPSNDLYDYLEIVERNENEARGAYSKLEPPINRKDFVEMMLLDCCFVLEFLLIEHFKQRQDYWNEGEKIYLLAEEEEEIINPNEKLTWSIPLLKRDMLLLENQLPFFLLEAFHNLHIPHQTIPFRQIVCRIFSDLMPGKIDMVLDDDIRISRFPIDHILHLIHSCAMPESKTSNAEGHSVGLVVHPELTQLWIPSATMLREMGVVFKRKSEYATFLDVTFNRGVMEIPPLRIFNHIGSILHNLIAFEQCCTTTNKEALSFNFYFSSYACLMNLMVNKTDDVRMLKRDGIIFGTFHSDDDVVNLFDKLDTNTMTNIICYYPTSIFNDIQIYCNKRTSRWKATLNQNWEIISVAAATFLFVLSITQTVLAFFSYLRPISPN